MYERHVQELILKKFLLKQKPRANVGKAEVKIFVVMCYYILLGVILISNLAYLHATADSVSEEVQAYFYCHSAGIQPDRDCGDVPEVHLQTLGILGLFLQRMLPIVIVIFIVDWKCNHKCLKRERTDLRG